MSPAKQAQRQSDQRADAKGEQAQGQRVPPLHLRQAEKLGHEAIPRPQGRDRTQ